MTSTGLPGKEPLPESAGIGKDQPGMVHQPDKAAYSPAAQSVRRCRHDPECDLPAR